MDLVMASYNIGLGRASQIAGYISSVLKSGQSITLDEAFVAHGLSTNDIHRRQRILAQIHHDETKARSGNKSATQIAQAPKSSVAPSAHTEATTRS